MAKKRQTRVVARKESTLLSRKRINPFEIQTNRRKHVVLGKKREREEWGRPGVSRAKAVERRRKTLLREYKERNKTNQFVDRRFGEYDPKLSAEERMLQRFVIEKRRRHEKANLFHLGDEEGELTHYGRALGDDCDDLELQWSSEGEDEKGAIDANTHFGGFLQKKQSSEGAPKTRKEIIGEMVAVSKQHKHLRQVEREHVEGMMMQVDQEWKSLHSLLPKTRRGDDPSSLSDYDHYMRELAMEPRGQAVEPLKTLEQQELEKQQKLKRLKTEAMNRMRGLPSSLSDSNKMTSADYIPDGPANGVDDRVTLQYVNGKLILPEGRVELAPLASTMEDASPSPMSAGKSDEEELSESGSEEEEQFSDLYSDDAGDSGEEDASTVASGDIVDSQGTSNKSCLTQTAVPDTVQEFVAMTIDRKPAEVGNMVEQIRHSYPSPLSAGDKEKLEGFLAVILGYCLQVAEELDEQGLLMLDVLARPIFHLAQVNPSQTAQLFQKLLTQARNRVFTSKGGHVIRTSELVLMRLLGVAFPTTDYQHPVVTPGLQLMATHLARCRVKNYEDVCKGLLLCQTVLQYVAVSKRLVPEVLTYLNGVLGCFVPLCSAAILPIPFSAKTRGQLDLYTPPAEQQLMMNLLQLVSNGGVCCSSQRLCRLFDVVNDGQGRGSFILGMVFRTSIVKNTLCLLLRASKLWAGLPSADALFSPIQYNLERIDAQQLADPLLKLHRDLQEVIMSMTEKPKPVLQLLRRKPKSIKFFEPLYEEDYQPGKRRAKNRIIAERTKLRHKYKRELKGSLRELKKDSRFLAREKLQETLLKDAERKKKVKQIQAWLEEDKRDSKMIKKMSQS